MKRIFLTRRRRYLYRAVLVGAAVAVMLPTTAMARPEDRSGVGNVVVDPYTTSGISAEDDHGHVAGTGYVLPSGDRKALENAVAQADRLRRADDFAPPRTTAVTSSAPAWAIEWDQIALFSSLALLGITGLLMLVLVQSRRGTRVAHS